MPTELPLDALEMALWTCDRAGHDTAENPGEHQAGHAAGQIIADCPPGLR
jgi:hypothetical protein